MDERNITFMFYGLAVAWGLLAVYAVLLGLRDRDLTKQLETLKRMVEENPHLTEEMARHLTIHGMRTNEDDGSLSWKFDNYVRLHSPYEFNIAEAREIWNQIRCPVQLVRGSESWASDPEMDGKASAFQATFSKPSGP